MIAGHSTCEYNNRKAVPDFSRYLFFDLWASESLAARKELSGILDIPYGESDANRLDLFTPYQALAAPVFVFIHGGYWRSLRKEHAILFVARRLMHAGIVTVLLVQAFPERQYARTRRPLPPGAGLGAAEHRTFWRRSLTDFRRWALGGWPSRRFIVLSRDWKVGLQNALPPSPGHGPSAVYMILNRSGTLSCKLIFVSTRLMWRI